MKLTTRAATVADVKARYPEHTASFRAWVAELDGEPKGIVGVALYRPVSCLFSTFDEELREHLNRPAVLRIIKNAQRVCERSKIPVRAVAEPTEPNAPRLLKRLGFVHIGTIDDDEVYEYEGVS